MCDTGIYAIISYNTLKRSYKRTFSISFFWQCADDIELIFAQICAFIWTTVWWYLEKKTFTSSFFGKKCKNNVFEDKWFLSKMISQNIMQAATNWSSHLKKSSNSFQMTDCYAIFNNHIFLRSLRIISSTRKNHCMRLILCKHCRQNPTNFV